MAPLAAVTILIILGGPPVHDALCPFSSHHQGIQTKRQDFELDSIHLKRLKGLEISQIIASIGVNLSFFGHVGADKLDLYLTSSYAFRTARLAQQQQQPGWRPARGGGRELQGGGGRPARADAEVAALVASRLWALRASVHQTGLAQRG